LKGTSDIWSIDSNTTFNKGVVKINIGQAIPVNNIDLNDLTASTQKVVEELQNLN
jgi:hypothetical protein